MDAKDKIRVDKPEILDNYRFMMGRNFFMEEDGFQNLLIYPPLLSHVQLMLPTDQKNMVVKNWKSSGLLDVLLVEKKGTAPTASMKSYVFEVDFN